MTTPIQELQLIRRTAWLNIQREIQPPKDADRKDITTAMYMLAYLGAIDMVLYDLIAEANEKGIYKHKVKHSIGRVHKVVASANGLANSILTNINDGVRVRQYTDMYEYAYNKVQKHILIEPPHRAYSIFKALARLFTKAYNRVGTKTNHHYLRKVVDALPLIDIPELKDHNVDFIIGTAVQIELCDLSKAK